MLQVNVTTATKYIVYEFSNCFGEIGCFPGEHHIHLKNDTVSVVSLSRRVPFAHQQKIVELDCTEKLGFMALLYYCNYLVLYG